MVSKEGVAEGETSTYLGVALAAALAVALGAGLAAIGTGLAAIAGLDAMAGLAAMADLGSGSTLDYIKMYNIRSVFE